MNFSGLPSMQHAFHLSVKGSDTGQSYDGDFIYQRPNYSQKANAAKLTAKLNGDLISIDDTIKFVNSILGHLKFTLIECPDWWEKSNYGLDLFDDNVILAIFKTTEKFEEDWHNEVWKKEPSKPNIKDDDK